MTELASKTRRAARRLRLVTLAGIALILIGTVFVAFVLLTGDPDAPSAVRIETSGLAPVPAAALAALTGALLVIALFHLTRMLRAVEAGIAFPAPPLRRFAAFLFLAVLAAIFGPPLIQFGLGLAGQAPREIQLAIGGGEALMLFVTGLFFFVARLLDAAQAVADDMDQIV